MTDTDYMKEAFNQAFSGMRNNEGGPFGAVVVQEGEIIGRGCNKVTSTNDPSAHAEIVAIREACHNKNSYHLVGASIYTTCEPCPMCLAAIYWANIRTVYYCLNSEDAARIGFDDKYIYGELAKDQEERNISMKKVFVEYAEQLYQEWSAKKDKKVY